MDRAASNNVVIPFPEREYILRCHRCKVNAFYVILNSERFKSIEDVKGFECSECNSYTSIEGLKESLKEEEGGNGKDQT